MHVSKRRGAIAQYKEEANPKLFLRVLHRGVDSVHMEISECEIRIHARSPKVIKPN